MDGEEKRGSARIKLGALQTGRGSKKRVILRGEEEVEEGEGCVDEKEGELRPVGKCLFAFWLREALSMRCSDLM